MSFVTVSCGWSKRKKLTSSSIGFVLVGLRVRGPDSNKTPFTRSERIRPPNLLSFSNKLIKERGNRRARWKAVDKPDIPPPITDIICEGIQPKLILFGIQTTTIMTRSRKRNGQ